VIIGCEAGVLQVGTPEICSPLQIGSIPAEQVIISVSRENKVIPEKRTYPDKVLSDAISMASKVRVSVVD